MTHLADEIQQQPDVVQTLIDEEFDAVRKIAAAIRKLKPAFVMLAARGTSDNAARYAQYALTMAAGMPVALATPSIHTLYQMPPALGKGLVIGISQSGQSEDIRRVIADARGQGALTLAITNYAASPLAQAAEHHLPLRCGEERAVAATKTYTAELTLLAMLATALSKRGTADLKRLPAWMRWTLQNNVHIEQWAERYKYAPSLAVIGRGYNYSTAYEISLKVKELTGMTSQEYSEADFRHGPIAVVGRGYPVLVVSPHGVPQPLLLDLLDRLRERRAETLVISNDEAAIAKADKSMRLPPSLPEWISPICAVLPGQILAMHIARERGLDVDKPEGLTKVTNTE